MPLNELQKCNNLIKQNKIEVIDLKAIDLTGRLHHISLPVYPIISWINLLKKESGLMVPVMDSEKLKTVIWF